MFCYFKFIWFEKYTFYHLLWIDFALPVVYVVLWVILCLYSYPAFTFFSSNPVIIL
jgi:hypothetical protein